MINYHSLCYFCEIVGHFEFYPPKIPPMNIQYKQIVCGKEFVLGFFLTFPDY